MVPVTGWGEFPGLGLRGSLCLTCSVTLGFRVGTWRALGPDALVPLQVKALTSQDIPL